MTCGKNHKDNCPTEATGVDHAEVEGRPLCDHAGCDKRVVGTGERCADGHVQGLNPALQSQGARVSARDIGEAAPLGTSPGSRRGTSAFSVAAQQGQKDSAQKLRAGVTGAILCQYRDDGVGVEKPLRAHPRPDGSYGHDGNSEVAANVLAVLLSADGVGVVPETVFSPAHEGTAQQFIPGLVATNIPVRQGEFPQSSQSALPPPEFSPVADIPLPADWGVCDLVNGQAERVLECVAVDIVMGHWDRHPGNVLFDSDGRLWAIDNGHATWTRFGSAEFGALAVAESYLLLWLSGQDLPRWARSPAQVQKSGELTFPAHMVERWRQITKEQFLAAFAAAAVSTTGNVDLETGWANLQYILNHDGTIRWNTPLEMEESCE